MAAVVPPRGGFGTLPRDDPSFMLWLERLHEGTRDRAHLVNRICAQVIEKNQGHNEEVCIMQLIGAMNRLLMTCTSVTAFEAESSLEALREYYWCLSNFEHFSGDSVIKVALTGFANTLGSIVKENFIDSDDGERVVDVMREMEVNERLPPRPPRNGRPSSPGFDELPCVKEQPLDADGYPTSFPPTLEPATHYTNPEKRHVFHRRPEYGQRPANRGYQQKRNVDKPPMSAGHINDLVARMVDHATKNVTAPTLASRPTHVPSSLPKVLPQANNRNLNEDGTERRVIKRKSLADFLSPEEVEKFCNYDPATDPEDEDDSISQNGEKKRKLMNNDKPFVIKTSSKKIKKENEKPNLLKGLSAASAAAIAKMAKEKEKEAKAVACPTCKKMVHHAGLMMHRKKMHGYDPLTDPAHEGDEYFHGTPGKNYPCPFCEEDCQSPYALRQHKYRAHNK